MEKSNDGLFYWADFDTIKKSSWLEDEQIWKINHLLLWSVDNVVFYLKFKLDEILEKQTKYEKSIEWKIYNFFWLDIIRSSLFNEFKKWERIEQILENLKNWEIWLWLADKARILKEAHNLAWIDFNEDKYIDLEMLQTLLEWRNIISWRKKDWTFWTIPEIADGATGIAYKIFYDKFNLDDFNLRKRPYKILDRKRLLDKLNKRKLFLIN